MRPRRLHRSELAAATDERLVAAIANGDGDAFSAFYRRHVDAVVAFHRRRVPAPEVAFDLTAETFAAVVEFADRFEGTGPAAGWLYGIARNKLRESLRRGKVEADARARLHLEPVALTDDAIEHINERAARGEGSLDRALASLPARTREALVARVIAEEPYDETARRLGCSAQVLRKRVERGLSALRAAMEEER